MIQASGPKKPDLLGLLEIENKAVAQKLAKRLGYQKFSMTDSPDSRGIDVALFFNESKNLKLLKTEAIRIPSDLTDKETRDILKVTFRTLGKNLVVYVNHWPSQAAPAIIRKNVAEVMMKSASQEMKKGHAVVAIGDFNVIPTDRPDPFYEVLSKPNSPSSLVDIHTRFMQEARGLGLDARNLPLGTYFFAPGMSWNLLDRIFVSPDLLQSQGLQADLKSYQILNPPFALEAITIQNGPHAGSVIQGAPKGYDFSATDSANAGFSDHFALLLNLTFSAGH